MTTIDFTDYAARLARESGMETMRPVIEKEILHYAILDSLDKQGMLSRISFQGGTCLRLCYGSERYSEDIDFAAGDNFEHIDLVGVSDRLTHALTRWFDVSVHVKSPGKTRDFGGVDVKRWWIVVNTTPARPDLPSQRIKIEIASVPSHTRVVHPVSMHYNELPASLGSILAVCQTPEEILADKLISFSDAKRYVRYRDLWDIPWLLARPKFDTSVIAELVARKHEDYQCGSELQALMASGEERAVETVRSREFAREMERFLPGQVISRTVGRTEYLDIMAQRLQEAYHLAGGR